MKNLAGACEAVLFACLGETELDLPNQQELLAEEDEKQQKIELRIWREEQTKKLGAPLT